MTDQNKTQLGRLLWSYVSKPGIYRRANTHKILQEKGDRNFFQYNRLHNVGNSNR